MGQVLQRGLLQREETIGVADYGDGGWCPQ